MIEVRKENPGDKWHWIARQDIDCHLEDGTFELI